MSDRNFRRARLRMAYDELSKNWRTALRKQRDMLALGLQDSLPLLGRKPPLSQFARISGLQDPTEVALRPHEVLEHAREIDVNWRGRDVRLVEPERGVMTIPIAGDDEEQG